MRCVEGVLGLGGHVVIGVVLGFTTQTQYQVQISFLLNFVVRFCTCSQTVFCDRQFLSVANCCTLLHRENGSFEVLSLHMTYDGLVESGKATLCESDSKRIGMIGAGLGLRKRKQISGYALRRRIHP